MANRTLEGKVALVTGAARGVGRAIAVELADLGADVVVTARSVTPRDDISGTILETADAIRAAGRRALAVGADLTVPEDRKRVVASAMEEFGRIDVLINAASDAGPSVFRGFWETTPEAWNAQIDLNLNTMYWMMKACAPVMRDNGAGLIVNLGSMREIPEGLAGAVPEDIIANASGDVHFVMHGDSLGGAGVAYPTSKVAIFTMSTLVAQELISDGIVIFTLHPGGAKTENFIRNAKLAGLDPDMGTPVVLPAKTVGYIATCEDPSIYAGLFVDAVKFCAEKGISAVA